MRVTRDLLLEIAHKQAEEIVYKSNDIVSIYLTGSVVNAQPLLGGATDIDLVCIHAIQPPVAREVVRLADEFHLDIAHYPQSRFSQPRNLRTEVWLGSYLCYEPISLYDTQHWFDFTRAVVFAHFLQPVNIMARVRPLAQQARQKWQALTNAEYETSADQVWDYLLALEWAANATACLVGVPLTERRFLLDLPARAEALQRPGLAAGLVDLIVPTEGAQLDWQLWLEEWRKAIQSANEKKTCPVRLDPLRIPYYEKAISVLAEENREAALWILLRTWTLALTQLAKRAIEVKPWQTFIQTINLDHEHFAGRLVALDSYLEAVEDTLDGWAKQNGV
jgi:hypothetical protein